MKPRKSLSPVACLLLALSWIGHAVRADDGKGAQKPADSVAEGAKEEAADEEEVREKAKIAGLAMLPAGKKNLGVRLPVYEGSRQTMLFKADELTPVDADELEMNGVEIRIMSEGGGEDTKIEMASGRYVVSLGLLSSDEETVVQGADYTIVGDSMDFDTGKKTGVMRGHVMMIIHDFDKLAGDTKEEKVKGTDATDKGPAETETPQTNKNDEK